MLHLNALGAKIPCAVSGKKSVVVHECASNCGADVATDAPERLPRYRYLYRNDVYLYRREGLRGFCYEVLRLGWHAVKILCLADGDRLKRLQCIVEGTLEGVSFDPEAEKFGDNDGSFCKNKKV